jgi:hypothetical protein
MSTLSSPDRSFLDDPLAAADRQVAEAERRHDRQRYLVTDLADGTEARAYAEHVLRVMEQTLAMSGGHRAFIHCVLELDNPSHP